jgi:hypothetical protein
VASRAAPSRPDRQHLATAGVLNQQRKRCVHRHCGEEEAQHGTGLGEHLVAGERGEASDQEPRRGEREYPGGGLQKDAGNTISATARRSADRRQLAAQTFLAQAFLGNPS